ncbi:MAG: endolytic transglycosylase MltG [Termitinemataceae bacterium]|nr:MAG: endolytic transglycosylase MltG [Termitinemataceae bacterium]
MKKSIFKIFRNIFGALILFCATLAALVLYLNSAPKTQPVGNETIRIDDKTHIADIEIREGESGVSVGKRLYTAGLIRNAEFWKLLMYTSDNFIKHGVYHIEYPQTQVAIYRLLQEGKEILVKVTVPEGVTVKKIASILDEKNICTKKSFIGVASDGELLKQIGISAPGLEGFLFPDTYMFPQSYGAKKAAAAMVENFFKHVKDMDIDVSQIKPNELYNKITLASIVEREYRSSEEAPIIGGVFVNRIKAGMRLESCATVEYIITEIQNKPHPKRLFNRDIAIENKYNTYVFAGLPPGPISCPGEVALKAAFFPTDSDYLFFRVVDPSEGKHYFSKTFDDHIKAGELYLKNTTG